MSRRAEVQEYKRRLRLCEKALKRHFTELPELSPDGYSHRGLCSALEDSYRTLAYSRDMSARRPSADDLCLSMYSVMRDLERHVGDATNSWGGCMSEALPDYETDEGFFARQKLLKLAVRHYKNLIEDKRGLLRVGRKTKEQS